MAKRHQWIYNEADKKWQIVLKQSLLDGLTYVEAAKAAQVAYDDVLLAYDEVKKGGKSDDFE